MQTFWGDIPVVDAHVHFFSHGFFELLARQKPGLTVDQMGPLLGWEMPPVDPAELAARWMAELDTHGVEGAALIASLPGDESSVQEAVKMYPDRFFGFHIVNPMQGLIADFSGLSVPCLFPAMHGYSLHDPAVAALLKAVDERSNPVVLIHCGVLSVGVRKKLGLASRFDLRYSNPVDVHALALQYPRIRFILPHFGAGFFREALMVADLCPNVYFDTSSSNQWMKYLDGNWDLTAVLRRTLAILGPKRLLFGTDSSFFPRGWQAPLFAQQAAALESIGISHGDAEAIFGGNLLQLLGR